MLPWARRSRLIGWGFVLIIALSSLSGFVCADERGDQYAMECEKSVHNCDMDASMHDAPADCCKPDRTSKTPASFKSTFRDTFDLRAGAELAIVPVVSEPPVTHNRAYVFSASRGSPPSLSNRPLDVPLLN